MLKERERERRGGKPVQNSSREVDLVFVQGIYRGLCVLWDLYLLPLIWRMEREIEQVDVKIPMLQFAVGFA